MSSQSIPSVLFVCMGNICRSPTGEGVFRSHLADHGLGDAVEVDSAGTIAYHAGEPADPRMRSAAERRGYRLDSRARRVRPDDLDRFDLIVAMDRQNLADLRDLAAVHGAASDKLRLLSDFLLEGGAADVPDPYYGGAQGFETVLDMIEAACPALLDELVGSAESNAAAEAER